MKTLYIGLAIIIVIYGTGVFMSYTLNSYLDAADKIVGEIEEATRNEDWVNVKKQIDRLTEMWPEKHKNLAYMIDHSELDKIEYAIARIDGENILHDKTLLYPELVSLRKIIEQVRGKYALKLCNII